MKEIKVVDGIFEKAANAVSSAESNARYWQIKINYCTSRLADLQGEKGEKFARRRRCAMRDNGACDYYDEFGRMAYLTADDLRREVESEIYHLEKSWLWQMRCLLKSRQNSKELNSSLPKRRRVFSHRSSKRRTTKTI